MLTKKNIIVILTIILVILFLITLYLVYSNFSIPSISSIDKFNNVTNDVLYDLATNLSGNIVHTYNVPIYAIDSTISSQITIPDINGKKQFSIECLFKYTGTDNNGIILNLASQNNTNSGYHASLLEIHNGRLLCQILPALYYKKYINAGAVINGWNYCLITVNCITNILTCSLNGNNYQLYYNIQPISSSISLPDPFFLNISIDDITSISKHAYNGQIAFLRMYNGILTNNSTDLITILTNLQPATTPVTTQPTSIKLNCSDINMQSLNPDDIREQCNNTINCYYTNNSCYDQSQFNNFIQKTQSQNGLFSCNIGSTNDNSGYLLQCPNADRSRYLFNTISQSNDCSANDNTCNFIKMSSPNLSARDINPKLVTVEYANGNLPKPLFLSTDTVNKLTNNFATPNLTGSLYFTDINNVTQQVPYNIVPNINDIPSINQNMLSPNYNLLSNIKNLNANIMQNLNLINQ